MVDRRLRSITGWALLIGAAGIFIDSWASWALDSSSPEWLVSIVAPAGLGDGSIGLIPAYIGATIGMIGLVIVVYRTAGMWTGLLSGAGVLGMLVFWYSYPDRATFGGVGGILIGVAILTLPGWGRLASPLWVAGGVMGIPELVTPGRHWGPVAGFTLVGAAIGLTGAFVVWGIGSVTEKKNVGVVGGWLRSLTGWALLIGAAGIFIDAWAKWALDSNSPDWLVSVVTPSGLGLGGDSIGMIPATLGVTVGMIGLVIVLYRTASMWTVLLAGTGVLGTLVFWYSYPNRATFGGVGGILIGIALVTLPGWGRLASPIWVAAGVMLTRELVVPGRHWGPIAAYSLLGAALAVTGAFVVWGISSTTERAPSLRTSAQPAR